MASASSNLFANVETFINDVSSLWRAHSPKRPKRKPGEVAQGVCPFEEEQIDWLSSSLDQTMKHFGTHVDVRFKTNERIISENRTRIVKLEEEMAAMRAEINAGAAIGGGVQQVVFEQALTRLGDAEKKLAEEMCARSELGGESQSSSTSVPYEQRIDFGTSGGTQIAVSSKRGQRRCSLS